MAQYLIFRAREHKPEQYIPLASYKPNILGLNKHLRTYIRKFRNDALC